MAKKRSTKKTGPSKRAPKKPAVSVGPDWPVEPAPFDTDGDDAGASTRVARGRRTTEPAPADAIGSPAYWRAKADNSRALGHLERATALEQRAQMAEQETKEAAELGAAFEGLDA